MTISFQLVFFKKQQQEFSHIRKKNQIEKKSKVTHWFIHISEQTCLKLFYNIQFSCWTITVANLLSQLWSRTHEPSGRLRGNLPTGHQL